MQSVLCLLMFYHHNMLGGRQSKHQGWVSHIYGAWIGMLIIVVSHFKFFCISETFRKFVFNTVLLGGLTLLIVTVVDTKMAYIESIIRNRHWNILITTGATWQICLHIFWSRQSMNVYQYSITYGFFICWSFTHIHFLFHSSVNLYSMHCIVATLV